jgi:prepilin-type N-terminal cleavage/methylation domain-containing protein
MNVPKQKNDKGFTIIEVVLVLAIAALIFLMVFIALPALQRSQRDTQRKNDMGRVQTAVQNYQSNNRNTLPTFNQAFANQYLTTGGDTFLDPAGAGTANGTATTYQFSASTSTLTGTFSPATQNIIYVSTGYTCGTGGAVTKAGSTKVALRMYLEGGSVACVNN